MEEGKSSPFWDFDRLRVEGLDCPEGHEKKFFQFLDRRVTHFDIDMRCWHSKFLGCCADAGFHSSVREERTIDSSRIPDQSSLISREVRLMLSLKPKCHCG